MEHQGQGSTIPFRLVILGDGSVRTIPLLGNRWVVGRSPDCEIPLRDPTVSRQHVLLERNGDEFMFRDLGGRNRILLDGKPSSGGQIAANQSLSIGLTRLLLESREQPRPIERGDETVVITGREVLDDGLADADGDSAAGRARRILERIEWTFADLGSLADAAEPLLALAMNLTGRQRGLIGQFLPTRVLVEVLATLDTADQSSAFAVPEALLHEAQQLRQASLLTVAGDSGSAQRLVIPLGAEPDGLLILDNPTDAAPDGQELLRLAHTLGKVVWHRLSEVRERLRLRGEVQRLRFHGTPAHNAVLTSTRLQGSRQALRALAHGEDPVLLVGEEGTEREDLARYLHAEGPGQGPFVSIQLGMVPEWRLEKALFGDGVGEAGALSKASGGTLFLDGITLLPEALQDRLIAELATLPVRLVAASEAAPTTGDDANSWRPALAELAGTHVVAVPPLRDEAADAVALAELFLSDMGSGPDGSPRLLSERAKRLLRSYSWPGNVRQLRQVLESAAAQAGTSQIAPKHLPRAIAEPPEDTSTNGVVPLEELERRHIRATLKRLGGNRTRTAQALGIAASTLYDKLRRFGIEA